MENFSEIYFQHVKRHKKRNWYGLNSNEVKLNQKYTITKDSNCALDDLNIQMANPTLFFFHLLKITRPQKTHKTKTNKQTKKHVFFILLSHF